MHRHYAINFVPASNNGNQSEKDDFESPGGSLSGGLAQAIYEEIIAEPSERQFAHHNEQLTEKPPPTQLKPKEHYFKKSSKVDIKSDSLKYRNVFLKYATEGNIEKLNELIAKNIDINVKDNYQWTALMCAAKANNYEAVDYLLRNEADISCKDLNGLTAFDLTSSSSIKKLFLDLERHETLEEDGNEVSTGQDQTEYSEKSETLYCKVCSMSVADIDEHEKSIPHIMNKPKLSTGSCYYIPCTNKGYQLMMRQGWDGNKALGKDSEGSKYPIKTVLKRDRKGLGGYKKKQIPRVTHFDPFDEKAVKRGYPFKADKQLTVFKKKHFKEKLNKEKKIEKFFRQEFRSDYR